MKQLGQLLFILWFIASACKAQVYLGDYSGYSVNGKMITLQASSSAVRFTFYKPDVLRVDFLPTPTAILDSSLVVIRDTTENVATSVLETDSTVEISSSAIKIVCRKTPLRISYYDASGKLLLKEPASGGLATNEVERIATFSLSPNDHFYGTGERGTSLDKRGQAFESYNTQIGGYTSALATMNINVPFLASTNGYALYFENTYRGWFDLGASDPAKFSYEASGGELSYYLIAAPTVPELLEIYTWLTGRQPLPPRWAFGFIQSKFGYRNETEARAIVQMMRQKQIPCDAIILDLYWFNHMGDISWNLFAWPDPFQMMGDFLEQGFKTIVITEPYIVQYSSNYSLAASNGYFAQNNQGQPYLLSNWWSCGCNAALLDLTNPAAQSWWWSQHPAFFGDRLAGIWTDLGEPERHPDGMQHYLGSAPKVHNIFNLLWAKTIFEGFSQIRPEQRLFNLTRSGYAGIQRYGAIPWSGDVGRLFGGLAVQIPMLLNMGMSGLAYHNSDIGGFCCGTTTPELYVRWMQYGTFCPIARAHGVDQPTEPWGYGSEAEEISKKYIQLRYRLLPYIYTMAYENYTTGLPLARPLFFEDPGDRALQNESSSYLWGDALLVSPVVRAGRTTKSLYLPRGKWIDYWTDQEFEGGQSVAVAAPLETLPLFVKSGSIIPLQPVMNYSDERPLDTLMLAIYPSLEEQGSFTLYEDDGETLAYQSGSFAQTTFTESISSSVGDTSLVITIGTSQGFYDGKPLQRVYISEVHRVSEKPSAVLKNGRTLPERFSYGELRWGNDGFFYDNLAERLFIHTPTFPDSSYVIVVENIQLVVSVAGSESGQPMEYLLEQNYPNPFNQSTTIGYRLASRSHVVLQIVNVLGQVVSKLIDEEKPAGRHEAKWDGGDLASGVYFYRLQAVDPRPDVVWPRSRSDRRSDRTSLRSGQWFVETRKLILLK